jgi:hypothetical protein
MVPVTAMPTAAVVTTASNRSRLSEERVTSRRRRPRLHRARSANSAGSLGGTTTRVARARAPATAAATHPESHLDDGAVVLDAFDEGRRDVREWRGCAVLPGWRQYPARRNFLIVADPP